jgi:ABC-type transporter Mla subunit MlaD
MPDATMKSIEFEVKGSADKSSASVTKLVSALTELKKITSGGIGLATVGKEVKDFSNAVKAFSPDNIRKFSDSIKELGKVRVGTAFAKSFSKLNETIKQIDNAKLNAVKNTMTALQGGADVSVKGIASFSKFIEVVDGKGDQIKDLASTLREIADIDFSNLSAASDDLKAIADSVRTYAEAARKTRRNPIKDESSTFQKIRDAVGRVGVGISSFAKGLKKVSSFIGGVAKVVSKTIVPVFKFAFNAAKGIVEKIVKLPSQISEAFKKKFEDIKDKIIGIGSAAKKFLSESVLTKPIRNAAESAKNFVKKINSLGSALGRVAFYRGVRTLIKEIGDAFKIGINNLYEWSNAAGGQFAASMDRMATSLTYFKNSIGAATAPILNALAPVLDFLIDKIVTLLNLINQLFARLMGQSYWTRAIKQAQSYGSAASSAGSAAKEAMRYLAPFDELNVLPSDNDGGGGGGGGAGGGIGDMFEDVTEFNEDIANFAERIKDAVRRADWKGLGTLLGEEVNKVVDMIPWKSIGEKFGTGVNAVISTEYWTLETINFDNIGASIAEMINGALDKMLTEDTFTTWGNTISRKLTAAFDTAIGFITGSDGKEGLDTEAAGQALHDFFIGIFDELYDWFSTHDFEELETEVRTKVEGFFTGLQFDEIALSFVQTLGTALGSAAAFIGKYLGDVGKPIKDWFDKKIKGKTWKETGKNILTWIGNGFSNIATWVDTNFITPFVKALGVEDKWAALKQVGAQIWVKIRQGFPTAVSWINTNIINPVKRALETGDWKIVFDRDTGVLASLKNAIGDVYAWAITNIVNPIGRALSGASWDVQDKNGNKLTYDGYTWDVAQSSWTDLDPEKGREILGKIFGFDIGDWIRTNLITPIAEELKKYNWSGLWDYILNGLRYSIDKMIYGEKTAELNQEVREGKKTEIGPNGGYYVDTEEMPEKWGWFKNLFPKAYALDEESASELGITVPVTASITDVVDNIPLTKKITDGYNAIVTEKTDSIKDKVLSGWQGILERASVTKETIADPVPTKGDITHAEASSSYDPNKALVPVGGSIIDITDNVPATKRIIDKVKALISESGYSEGFEKPEVSSSALLTDTDDRLVFGSGVRTMARFIKTDDKLIKGLPINQTAQMTKRTVYGDVTKPISIIAHMTERVVSDSVKKPIQTVAEFIKSQFASTFGTPIANTMANINGYNSWGDGTINWGYYPLANTKAMFNSYDTGNGWTSPWWYAKAWFNSHEDAKGWTSPWWYATAWFNSHDTASSWSSPWWYAKAWFNSWENYFSSKPWAYLTAYFNDAYAKISGVWKSLTTNADGGVFANGRWKPITAYAGGGAPGMGQLFLAREAGPELVGTLGGHTAVMNNDQIVASVSAGVAEANEGIITALIAAANQIVRAVEASGGSDGYDIEAISRGVTNYQRRQARAMGNV